MICSLFAASDTCEIGEFRDLAAILRDGLRGAAGLSLDLFSREASDFVFQGVGKVCHGASLRDGSYKDSRTDARWPQYRIAVRPLAHHLRLGRSVPFRSSLRV